ncbi:efflux RND transporter periplasmic adaptor subunit [Bowmanella denitrificans]|uniref:efflux RND transporter periplasmic adaptor subunit n=1 Tax=Bowmanella denitrificans TaxID=366582 RepID=UPI001FE52B08|nr:efflux RND transporter periplasmic adaptor subunit [Bowmanella denitrificans]
MKLFMPAAVCGCLMLLCGIFSAGVSAQAGPAARPAKVLTSTLEFERQSSRVEAVGTTEALQSVVLYPAVADRVVAVHFQPGDRVVKGQLLLELDARRQKVAVERAKILLADAERTVVRLQENRKRGAIAQSELDDAVTQRDLAKVQLDEANTELQDRQVIAPFDGVLGLTDVEVGDRINLQTAITSIDNRTQLFVNFRAPEAALGLLQSGATLNLRPWQNQEQEIPARIVQIDSRVDSASRTIGVRAIIDNTQDNFLPGMSFRVALHIEGDSHAVIPEVALSWGANGAYVWVARENKAERIEVQIKQRLKGRLLVSGALREGEQLITEGIQSLRDGQTVMAANG